MDMSLVNYDAIIISIVCVDNDIETRIRLLPSLAEFSVYEKEEKDHADNIYSS